MPIGRPDATRITLCSISSLKTAHLPQFPPHCPCLHCTPPQMWDLLRVKGKERRSSIVCRSKERENYRLIYERERRKSSMPTARAGARSRASVLRLGLQLSMGAGKADGGQTRLVGADEVNGGGKPPASCPSPPASKTKEASGANS
jgi:hypothetical protein